ncbi:MAG: GyrI-like domain-containing protein [Candidatus Riflebacteria bacterium]|nr:GyrI-like domain-containing protein [Candidatus Riflebacteria bacterium]
MKILAIIGIVLVLIVAIILIYLSGYGLFSSVIISEKNVGPYLLVYRKHIGDYKNVGPVMDKIYYDLKDNHSVITTKGFGLYYDNPQDVTTDNLRSIVGCIVEGKSIEDLKDIKNKYGIKEYPASKSVVAEFPFKGKISIILGIFKVYPKLSAYLNENKHPSTPIMELYDQPNEKIEYISSFDLSKEVFDSFLNSQ